MCEHYWIIDPPNGPTSNGTCKLCGETRPFINTFDELQSQHWPLNSPESYPITTKSQPKLMYIPRPSATTVSRNKQREIKERIDRYGKHHVR